MQSLAKVQAGESCEIKWMFGNADVMNFLAAPGPVRRLPSAASHHPAALCRNFAAYYFRSLHLCYLVE